MNVSDTGFRSNTPESFVRTEPEPGHWQPFPNQGFWRRGIQGKRSDAISPRSSHRSWFSACVLDLDRIFIRHERDESKLKTLPGRASACVSYPMTKAASGRFLGAPETTGSVESPSWNPDRRTMGQAMTPHPPLRAKRQSIAQSRWSGRSIGSRRTRIAEISAGSTAGRRRSTADRPSRLRPVADKGRCA